MFTRKVRNIFVILVLMLSVVLVPVVRADIVIEPDGVTPDLDIVIEPDGATPDLDIVIEPDGLCLDIVIEPDGVASRSI